MDATQINSDKPNISIPDSNEISTDVSTGLVKTTSRNNSSQSIRITKGTRVQIMRKKLYKMLITNKQKAKIPTKVSNDHPYF